jgi:hypothetical protein
VDTRDNAPLIAAGGGVLLFVSLLLSWIGEASFWELYDIVDILLALIALLAIAVGVGAITGNTINPPGGPGPAVYTSGLIAFSIVAYHVLEGDDRKIGMFIGLIGTIGLILGGLQLGRGPAAPRAPRTRVAEPPPPSQPPPPPPSSPGPGV